MIPWRIGVFQNNLRTTIIADVNIILHALKSRRTLTACIARYYCINDFSAILLLPIRIRMQSC